MRETVKFGEHVISDYYDVVDVKREYAGRRNTTQTVAGMDGAVLTDSTLSPVKISVTMMVGTGTVADRRRKAREIAKLVGGNEQKRLEIGSDDGLYYMAVMDSTPEYNEHVYTDRITIAFVAQSPILYGEERMIGLDTTSKTFFVGGTYKTRPRIFGEGLRTDSSGYFSVLCDGLVISVTGAASARINIDIDCEARTAKVNGATVLPTITSDWFELEDGEHMAYISAGTGSCSMSWIERWA